MMAIRNIKETVMQKKTLLLFITVALFTSFSSLSCTTILIGKGLTIDGSVIHAHNEDMGSSAVGRLWHVAAQTRKEGDFINVPYMTIPNQHDSYSYWASGNANNTSGLDISNQTKPYDSVLVGMNQWGVTMSCNWMNSKAKNSIEKGIRRYAIRQLILERAKTAREAVEIVGEFIEQYGQADWGGLTYNLSDTNESWVIETTTNNWVARRIKDNEIWVVANRFRIGTDFDLSSHSLINNAIQQSWYNPKTEKQFNFAKAYGKPEFMNQAYDIAREERVYSLLENNKKLLTADDLFKVLRDRYDGTSKFTPPQKEENWRELSEPKKIPRTIASNLAQSTSVAVLRSDLPIEVGAMMWYGMVNPQFSGYFPLYAGSTTVIQDLSTLDGKKSESSAWWAFKNLHNQAGKNYAKYYPVVKKVLSNNHAQMVIEQKLVENKALDLISKGNKEKAINLLNQFSYSQSKDTLFQAKRLLNSIKETREK